MKKRFKDKELEKLKKDLEAKKISKKEFEKKASLLVIKECIKLIKSSNKLMKKIKKKITRPLEKFVVGG
jgi:hypothetical protein